jgi:hypothetical protein
MKYALLLWDDPTAWADVTNEQMQALYDEYVAVAQDSQSYGGAELQPAETARTVRVRDGETIVTDGPFAETKEVISGIYLIEADDVDKVLAWAARIPTARMGGAVEVRPIVERG